MELYKKIIQIKVFCCQRCDYTWKPDDDKKLPLRCAKCGSPYWKTKRRKASEALQTDQKKVEE